MTIHGKLRDLKKKKSYNQGLNLYYISTTGQFKNLHVSTIYLLVGT